MNLKQYKELMDVTEEATACAELGEIIVIKLDHPDWEQCHIAMDVMHNTLLVLNQVEEIVSIYQDVFGVTPTDIELKKYLKALKKLKQ